MSKLQFGKIEPIEFGDFESIPKVTSELRLRLRTLKFETEAQAAEGKKVLAECFGEDQERVLAFMNEHMTDLNLRILQAYLLGGPQMLDMLTGSIISEAQNGQA